MNGINHKRIAGKSLHYLSEPVRKFWQPQELLEDASNFPDIFWPGENSSPDYIQKYPDWKEYIMIPCNDTLVNCHSAFDSLKIWETYPVVLNFLVHRALDAMDSGDQELAVKIAGVLSHIIGDTGQAAHVFDSMQLSLLFQGDEDIYLIHSLIENNPMVSYPDHPYTARCLGDNVDEFLWRLLQELVKLKKRSTRTIVPIMTATLKDDLDTAAQYASATVGACADLFADVLYTLTLIHLREKKGPDAMSLLQLEPERWHCDGMFNFLPQKNYIPGPTRRTPLPLHIGNGPQLGIALLPDMFPGCTGGRCAFVEYPLPPGVFQKFTFSCGLNRAADRNETAGIFEIRLDDKTVWESPALDIHSPSVSAEVNLGRAERLQLLVKDARRDTAETKFFYPCFIEPVLWRN